MLDTQDTLSGDAFGFDVSNSAEPVRMLLIITAAHESAAIELGERPLVVGRGKSADVLLQDRSLSRLHARFHRYGETVRVFDLGSRNGTMVNGKRVEEAELCPGDVTVLGNVLVSVQVVESPRAAALGLSSFRALHLRLEQECARARIFRRPLSLVFFRTAHGLCAEIFASACAEKLRSSDLAGIYDAHSLVVLLPETDALGAEVLARELIDSTTHRTSVVGGIASCPESAFTPDQLITAAMAAAHSSPVEGIAFAPRALLVRMPEGDGMIRRSTAMLEVARLVERVAIRSLSVLILGETGTGKELIAHELHRRSLRRDGPFRIVNCAAIPDNLVESVLFGHVRGAFTGADRARAGVFERAHGGTVFLDEVGELSGNAQAALLRVVETGRVCPVGGSREIEVDVRLVSATHRRLSDMVEQGTFRIDLYHRLNAFSLELPPLRCRAEEIGPLSEEFVRRSSSGAGGRAPRITEDARALLERYSWPGNVRELRNVVERAVALTETHEITPADLPDHIRNPRDDVSGAPTLPPPEPVFFPDSGIDLRSHVQQHEATLIRHALECTNGNQRKAAQLLNLPLRTLERRIRDLGLNRPNHTSPVLK